MGVELYTKDYCPHCHRAKALLSSKGIKFKDHDVTNDDELYVRIKEETGHGTVPIIFINGEFIGGNDELNQLENSGKLDELLK